jgi:hypothetical protein
LGCEVDRVLEDGLLAGVRELECVVVGEEGDGASFDWAVLAAVGSLGQLVLLRHIRYFLSERF